MGKCEFSNVTKKRNLYNFVHWSVEYALILKPYGKYDFLIEYRAILETVFNYINYKVLNQ